MNSATSTRNTSQVPQTTGDTQYNVRGAALLGASSAFSKPPVKPKPKANTYTGGNNGALLAATKVGRGSASNAPMQSTMPPLSRDRTGGSVAGRHPSISSGSTMLGVPTPSPSDRIPSPSNIAAKLAAARHSPMKPAEPTTDETPVPPTAALVTMFEQKRPTTPVKPLAEPRRPMSARKSPPPIRSPKPQRKITMPPEPRIDAIPPVSPKPKPKPKPRSLSIDGGALSKPNVSPGTPPAKPKPPQLAMVKTAAIRPELPPPKESRQSRPMSADLTRPRALSRQVSNALSVESDDVYVSAPEEQGPEEAQDEAKEKLKVKEKPTLPPPRRSTQHLQAETRPKAAPAPPKPRNGATSRSPAPASERQTELRPTSYLGTTPSSEALFRSNYQRESAKQLAQHLTGESISSAIVGAALASSKVPSRGPSRGPSPGRAPTPPLPARRHHHHHHLPSLHHDRSPSPQKQPGKLRTTLRKEPTSSSSEDESEKYRKKGTRVMGMRKKHPNKHHEGTRKRWRDSITERERKRYEGVWAANKGLYINITRDSDPNSSLRRSPQRSPQPDDPTNDVLNLVVKEIWSRSRLTDHVLEEVWDLVDGRGVGRLRREEFVVGLWLIDQRLKGRKLPLRVSDSVWDSVRGVGMKVKVKAHKGIK